jgi:hypothetical protein
LACLEWDGITLNESAGQLQQFFKMTILAFFEQRYGGFFCQTSWRVAIAFFQPAVPGMPASLFFFLVLHVVIAGVLWFYDPSTASKRVLESSAFAIAPLRIPTR